MIFLHMIMRKICIACTNDLHMIMYKKVIALVSASAATVDHEPLELLLLGLFSCTGVRSWVSCAGATAAPSCSHSDKLQSPTGILSTEGPLQEYCQLEN